MTIARTAIWLTIARGGIRNQGGGDWKRYTGITHYLFSVEGEIRRLRTDLYCDEESTDINGTDEPSNANMSIDEDKNAEKNDMDVSIQ